MRKVSFFLIICTFPLLFGPFLFSELYSDESIYKIMTDAYRLFNEGEYIKAESLCRKALEMDASFPPAYNMLGSIYGQELGYEEKAISYFKRSIALNPKQIDVYSRVAYLYNRLGNTQEAIAYLEKGSAFDPDNFQLNFTLGITYLVSEKDAYRAVEYLTKCHEKEPHDYRVLYLLGISYLLTDHKFAALEFVTRLRDVKQELLASKLESIIKMHEAGENVNMAEVLQAYNEKMQTVPSHKSEVQVSDPLVKIEGSGKIILKTKFVPKEGQAE